MTKRERKCVECGAEAMVSGREKRARTFGGVAFEVDAPVRVCGECDAVIMTASDAKRVEQAAARWLAEHGVHTPAAFRFMRKALGLRGAELGALLGVTKESISRWENGKHPIDRMAFAGLATMVIDATGGKSALRDRLEAMDTPDVPDGPVPLRAA